MLDELAPGIASITLGALRCSEMLVNLLQRDRRINKARLRLLTSPSPNRNRLALHIFSLPSTDLSEAFELPSGGFAHISYFLK
jgi:hypothetical protein